MHCANHPGGIGRSVPVVRVSPTRYGLRQLAPGMDLEFFNL
jgi:hypothetical protein